jgi:Protein of unknown function (DUF2878)
LYIRKFSLIKEISWLAAFLAIGFVVEMLFLNAGILIPSRSEKPFFDIFLPPLWLLCLWLLFATSMRTSLKLLFHKKWLGYLVSLIFAPASYYAGDILNTDIDIGTPLLLNLSIIGVTWLCAMGFIFMMQRYYFEDIFNDY